MEVSVSTDLLEEALAAHMASVTGGMLDMEVGTVFALDQAGHRFPISGLVIEAHSKTQAKAEVMPCERTTVTGNRLRLAAFEGERV